MIIFLHPLVAPLLALAHLVSAVAVTIHVLLNRREPAAAIGWIGLAWLSPFVGFVLYALFGINRVRRRARRLRPAGGRMGETERPAVAPGEAAGLVALAHAAGQITRRPALGGNQIETLEHGDIAYPAMLAAIARAEVSIGMASYIFRGDAVGRAFIEALAAAQARGVAVRVLIDGIGGGYFWSPAIRLLARHKVPCARFLHSFLPWRMPFVNLRNHRKLLLIDGRLAFTGGMNISSANRLADQPRHPVRDLHFRIEGPVVSQLATAFGEDWRYTTGETLPVPLWAPPIPAAGGLSGPVGAVARLVTSGPDYDLEKIEWLLLTALAVARHRVRIATPYFLPDERLISALRVAALRGVVVEITIPDRSDHPIFDYAARGALRPLLDAGCRVWLAAPPFNHSKLMTVDQSWSLIGSTNWDLRSLRLNFELGIEVYDQDLAAALDHRIEAWPRRRLLAVELDRRHTLIKLRDAAFHLLQPYL